MIFDVFLFTLEVQSVLCVCVCVCVCYFASLGKAEIDMGSR
jgi:hypothetical protein